MIISKTMTYMIQLTIVIIRRLYMGFRMAYLRLTLAQCKDQGQGHAYFDSEYLADDGR